MSVAGRREQEREERRHLILDAAERVFLAQGLETTTMDDVAAEARLGKGTLYLYFRNKDDLRLAVVSRRQQALLQRLKLEQADAQDGYDEMRRLLVGYAEHMASPIEQLKMVLGCWIQGVHVRGDLPGAVAHRSHIRLIFGMFRRAIERGRQDGSLRAGLPAAQVALQLWSAVNGALLLQLQLHHLGLDATLSGVDPLLVPPTLGEAVDLYLEGVRAHRSAPAGDRGSPPGPAAATDGAEGGEPC